MARGTGAAVAPSAESAPAHAGHDNLGDYSV